MYAMPTVILPILIHSGRPIESNKYYKNRETIRRISAQYGVDIGVATSIYISRDTEPPDEIEVNEWMEYMIYHTI